MPRLGIDVDKVIAYDRDPAASVLRFLETTPADLILRAAPCPLLAIPDTALVTKRLKQE